MAWAKPLPVRRAKYSRIAARSKPTCQQEQGVGVDAQALEQRRLPGARHSGLLYDDAAVEERQVIPDLFEIAKAGEVDGVVTRPHGRDPGQ